VCCGAPHNSTLDLTKVDATVIAVVVGVPLLAYHLYVAYLVQRANLSSGGQLLAVFALVTVPLLGALLVHGYVFGREPRHNNAANPRAENRRQGEI